jgi:hypothetical protein
LDADRNKGITITDEYELKQKPVALIQSFMTTCLVNIDTPGQLLFEEPGGRKVVLSYNANEWRASKEKLPMNQPEDTKFAATWEGKDIWRVVLTNMALGQKGKIMYVIKLLPS